MKYTFLLLFLPAIMAAQNVVSSKDTIMYDGKNFVRWTEVVLSNGQKSENATTMDSLTLAKTYENGIRQLANQVSEKNIHALERRQASVNIRNESAKIQNLSGANILDSVGLSVFNKIKGIDWVLSGVDTVPISVELGRTDKDFYLAIKKSAFRVIIYDDSWIQISDLYGKGIDLDLFLWRGAFVSPDYRIILSATGLKQNKPTPTSTTVSRRKTKE